MRYGRVSPGGSNQMPKSPDGLDPQALGEAVVELPLVFLAATTQKRGRTVYIGRCTWPMRWTAQPGTGLRLHVERCPYHVITCPSLKAYPLPPHLRPPLPIVPRACSPGALSPLTHSQPCQHRDAGLVQTAQDGRCGQPVSG